MLNYFYLDTAYFYNFKKMNFNRLFYFTIPKILIIKDVRLGLMNRCLQLCVFIYMFVNIFYYENYYKNEKPNGYVTSFWAETSNMYQAQRNYSHYIDNNISLSTTEYPHCQNPEYNYIYDLPYWDLSNVTCINIPYSEAYQKTEEELFFMTYFTENHIHIYDCDHPEYHHLFNSSLTHYENISVETPNTDGFRNIMDGNSMGNYSCQVRDTLDGNCLCQNYQNFFTIGIEHMALVFDYKYFTTFQKGGNFEDKTSQSVITEIYDIDNHLFKTIPKNTNIKLSIQECLTLTHTDLSDYNTATSKSQLLNSVVNESNYPHNRITGLDIVIKIDCSNHKIETGLDYNVTLCRIFPMVNEGWSSKGSKITYIKYPNLYDDYVESIYVDRYRYGIKFKFMFTGTIGDFDYFNLLNSIISAIVLFGSVATIIVLVSSNFLCHYTEKIVNESRSDSKTIRFGNLKYLCCKKDNSENDDDKFNPRELEEINTSTIGMNTYMNHNHNKDKDVTKPNSKRSVFNIPDLNHLSEMNVKMNEEIVEMNETNVDDIGSETTVLSIPKNNTTQLKKRSKLKNKEPLQQKKKEESIQTNLKYVFGI